MNKINILDSTIFNRIAAGEVVERPFSVLKELLDNSIDAGATEIAINVIEGGIKLVEVIDNGMGIEFDDLPRVFLPHATSKIKTIDDLDKIGTLGFRGEALASIGAVSEVKLVSKPRTQQNAGQVIINGGQIESINEIGGANGTTVSVSNIFYNVPARAKFLKKPKQEASDITNLVARYILANPTIKFKYNLDGKEVYSSTGNGLFEAIYSIYGKSTTEQILKVDYEGSFGIKINGYIGAPTFSKPNRTYQTLVVNGRYVINQMVSLCVYNAFEHYLMKGQFPFFVLNINMPVESLDVNVHPNKMDIRFENSNTIYGVVYQAVTKTLDDHARQVVSVNTKVFDFAPNNSSGVSFGTNNTEPVKITIKPQNVSNDILAETTSNEQVDTNEQSNSSSHVEFYENISTSNDALRQSNAIFSNIFNEVLSNQTQPEKKEQETFLSTAYNYIGTLFETYVIIQQNDECYIIDQHAAHERILFDKLVEQVNNHQLGLQSLIVPYILNVNNTEKQFIEDNVESFKELGFDIVEFGGTSFKISTVPTILSGINLKLFFDGILSELMTFKNLKKSDLIVTKLMQHSCKTAVKAGDKLNDMEISALLSQIKNSNMVLQCPHGRPVIIKISKKELEKWFKRIV